MPSLSTSPRQEVHNLAEQYGMQISPFSSQTTPMWNSYCPYAPKISQDIYLLPAWVTAGQHKDRSRRDLQSDRQRQTRSPVTVKTFRTGTTLAWPRHHPSAVPVSRILSSFTRVVLSRNRVRPFTTIITAHQSYI